MSTASAMVGRSVFKCAFLLLLTLEALSASSTGSRAIKREPALELVAVGDILLDRGIARRIEASGTRIVFANVKEILSHADVAFGNLECPLSSSCERAPQRITFRAEPRYVESLSGAGFDMLSLANNHSLDCGRVGLLETIENLKAGGLRWCGAGRTLAEAEAPVVLSARGIRIAFVGFTAIKPPSSPLASGPSKSAGAEVALARREALERAIRAAKEQADVVMVSLHWGVEYASRPVAEQVEMAHAAVAAGADVVLGHHTHTLEGLEVITERGPTGTRYALIAYSLGNFVFDSPSALGRRVRESAILRCRLSRNGLISAELLPVVLENYLPGVAAEQEAQSILARLANLSAELNTGMTDGRLNLKGTQ